jgi:hypothetical protein
MSYPLTPEQVEEIAARFRGRFGKDPVSIYLVGSHADGTATGDSDIDLVLETDLDLSKFDGPGFEFFREINPGRVPVTATGIGVGPGQVLIGSGPGDVLKSGLVDVFFRVPGNVWPPAVKLR